MAELPPFYNDLEITLEAVRRLLDEAVRERGAPFRHPTLITVDEGVPEGRVVVLRKVEWEQRQIFFYSDWRSGKVREIRREPRIAAVFYDKNRGIQVRLAALATLHHQDVVARQSWMGTAVENRIHYLTESPPGRDVSEPTSGLPPAFDDRPPSLEESEPGFGNFVVIRCQMWRMEWLYLHEKGHRRARFLWSDGRWKSSWNVP